jgi:murein DD-endopeptidase MepM/ murein hydrolase activator NlpD
MRKHFSLLTNNIMTTKHLLFSLLILVLSVFTALGQQAEREPDKTAGEQFEKNYNADDYEAIFASFATGMQEALPIQKTKEFFSDVKKQYGKITDRKLLRYTGMAGLYAMHCEWGTFALTLTVDANGTIIGLYIKPYTETDLPKMERTKTQFILPFHGEWTLCWGGDTPEQNYHVTGHPSQKHAIDCFIKDEKGKTCQSSRENNDDFYAFGKELIAPCEGEVVLVVDGVKDNKPGQMNPFFPTGNTVVLKTDNAEYLVFAHFKQHSIKVEQGQRVKQGDLLGLCGNSGNSSEAHLHFHVQNIEDLNRATGVKCYFAEILVNGEKRNDYSPLQNEKVKNTGDKL